MIYKLTDEDFQKAYRLARQFGRKHENEPPGSWESGAYPDGSPRVPWFPDVLPFEAPFVMGLLGEIAFAAVSGLPLDDRLLEQDLPAHDFEFAGACIQVKTGDEECLKIPVNKSTGFDLAVGALYRLATRDIRFLGWAYAPNARVEPYVPRKGVGGWNNYVLYCDALRPIEALLLAISQARVAA